MSEEDKKHISKLRKIEGNIKNSIDAVEIKETHYFAHHTYGRGVRIKKGSFVTGKIHRYSVMNILMEGVLRIKTSEGLERYEAPRVIIGAPGAKRAVFAEEDSFWLTIHATDQTDPELIEKEVIVEEYGDLMLPPPKHKPGGLTALENKTLNLLLEKKDRANE